MSKLFKRFFSREDGAVTADWVVITAMVVGLGFGAINILIDATKPKADNLGQFIEDRTIGL